MLLDTQIILNFEATNQAEVSQLRKPSHQMIISEVSSHCWTINTSMTRMEKDGFIKHSTCSGNIKWGDYVYFNNCMRTRTDGWSFCECSFRNSSIFKTVRVVLQDIKCDKNSLKFPLNLICLELSKAYLVQFWL